MSGDEFNLEEALLDIALEVWIQGEGFSGKRANGDSGWQWVFARELGFDIDAPDFDWSAVDALVVARIDVMRDAIKEYAS